jgi:hypothetical protein
VEIDAAADLQVLEHAVGGGHRGVVQDVAGPQQRESHERLGDAAAQRVVHGEQGLDLPGVPAEHALPALPDATAAQLLVQAERRATLLLVDPQHLEHPLVVTIAAVVPRAVDRGTQVQNDTLVGRLE